MLNKFLAVALGTALGVLGTIRCAGQQAHGVTPKPVVEGSATLVQHMDPGQMLRFSLVLQPVRQDQLKQFLRDVQDPQSPRFHHFLSFDQWKTRYAPADADVAKVDAWARQHGFTVLHRFRNNLALKVEANAATIEQAFDVRLNHYQFGSRRFFSNDREPAAPAELAGILKHVQGLNSYEVFRSPHQSASQGDNEPIYKSGPFLREETAHGGGNPQVLQRLRASATPSTGNGSTSTSAGGPEPLIAGGSSGRTEIVDLYSSEAYDLSALQRFSQCCNPTHDPNGSPQATSIAIIGQNTMSANDLQQFTSKYGMAFNLTQVMINSPACCDSEMTIDIESSTGMANSFGSFLDTAHVYAYEGGGPKLSDLLDAWDKAHSDDMARSASSSFGQNEAAVSNESDFTDIIDAMTAEGWSIAVAAGDHGAYQDCQNLSVNFPASYSGVTAVGGTTLTLTDNFGQPKFSSESSWSGTGCGATLDPTVNKGGGGGGCSGNEPAGSWQAVISTQCGNNRALPDLALNSGSVDAAGGVPDQLFYKADLGGWTSFVGTSIASPEFAGFLAHANSYLVSLGNVCSGTVDQPCAPLGNPDTLLWVMGAVGRAATGRTPFYDINDGSCNGGKVGGQGYCTSNGFDLATGWGSINMLQLAWAFNDALTHGALPQVNFSGTAAVNTWYNTDRTVSFAIVSPNPESGKGAVGIAGYSSAWDTAVADVLSHPTPGSGDSFYDGPASNGASGSFSLAAAGAGCHTAHVRAWDNAGQTSDDETYGPVCYDNVPPEYGCRPADGLWHATDAVIQCFANDQTNLSGLANAADASFTLTTSVPAGVETAIAQTSTHQVCDVAGNCVTAGPIGGNMVDKKPPIITITVPMATSYTVHQGVAANYGCVDGGSGINTCAGPVVSGSNIDTSSTGSKTFTVNASDNVSNSSTASVSYSVTYRICLQYNPAQATSSRAENILLQICDANGVNLSQMSIALKATGVDGNPAAAKPLGTLNSGNVFFYGPGTAPGASYQYVLDTQGLKNGSHVLNFVVQGDPVPHTAPFTLKK